MQQKVAEWGSLSSDAMSPEAIRRLYQPESHFRVSRNGYDAGMSFVGTSKAGRIYVISGRCSRSVGDWTAELGPGTFVDFPAGSFEFSVGGDEPVKLVEVWEIPAHYRRKDAA